MNIIVLIISATSPRQIYKPIALLLLSTIKYISQAMEIASYRHNPPECQRSDSPSRAFSSATTSSVIPPNHTKNESKSNTQAVDEATQEERPKRIIGDGNIFGHSSTTSYNDRDNRALFNHADNDDDQEIEAALALALPTSPVTDAVPLRAEASGPVDTQDNINNRSSLRDDIDPFETRLGFRHDREACAAYLMLPPVGSVGLLLLEQRNDYVRYVIYSSLIVIGYKQQELYLQGRSVANDAWFLGFMHGSLVCCLLLFLYAHPLLFFISVL